MIGAQLAAVLDVDVGDEIVLVLADWMRDAGRVSCRACAASPSAASSMPACTNTIAGSCSRASTTPRACSGRAAKRRACGSRFPISTTRATSRWRRRKQLANERGTNFYIDDWTRLHYTFFRSIQLQKSMMFVILSLVIAVAAFNIVSTLMMVVRDKRGDIAILRSFGTTQRSIMTLFASQGTFIGVIGTLLGVVLALLISWQLGNIVERAARLGSASISCQPRCITWRTCRRKCGRSRWCRSAAWRWRSPSPQRSIRP